MPCIRDRVSISIKLFRPFHFDDKEQFSEITSITSGTLPRDDMTENIQIIHDVHTVSERGLVQSEAIITI